MHCVYFILCPASARVYVGSTTDYRKRVSQHSRALERGNHCNVKLQRSYNRHKRLLFGILEAVGHAEHLIGREQYWIDLLEAALPSGGLNLSPTAGSTLGFPCSTETRRKIGEAHRGVKSRHFGKPGIMSGKTHTIEARRKISAAHLGRKFTPEHCAKIADAQRGPRNHRFGKPSVNAGKSLSKETRALISEKAKGRVLSAEHKAKISASNKGRKKSPETRARMSASRIKLFQERNRLANARSSPSGTFTF